MILRINKNSQLFLKFREKPGPPIYTHVELYRNMPLHTIHFIHAFVNDNKPTNYYWKLPNNRAVFKLKPQHNKQQKKTHTTTNIHAHSKTIQKPLPKTPKFSFINPRKRTHTIPDKNAVTIKPESLKIARTLACIHAPAYQAAIVSPGQLFVWARCCTLSEVTKCCINLCDLRLHNSSRMDNFQVPHKTDDDSDAGKVLIVHICWGMCRMMESVEDGRWACRIDDVVVLVIFAKLCNRCGGEGGPSMGFCFWRVCTMASVPRTYWILSLICILWKADEVVFWVWRVLFVLSGCRLDLCRRKDLR